MLMANRLLLFALSTGPHCRAARKLLEGLGVPYDLLEADLLAGPERERALAELARHNPALTFPTVKGGSRVVAGPLMDDLARLAARFAPGRKPPQAGGFSEPGPAAERRYETLAADQAYPFNPDRVWTLGALAGLLVNEARYGYGSCPGRLATGLAERDRPIVCPCAFRDEDVAKYGRCHCHLYFSPGAAATPAQAVPDRWLR